MAIWYKKNLRLDDIRESGVMGLSATLGMEWVEIGEAHLKMRMPVNNQNIQPYGLLHGGASCALAETIGSVASFLVINASKFSCVGLEINANHIRGARSGYVTATCTPLHLGRSTHVWDVKLHDDNGNLTCISRLTVAIIEKSF